MNFRKHQRDMLGVCGRILNGEPITQIVCSVTPGGGKSLIPQILAHKLIPGIAEKLCWVVPRLALQEQGAKGFHDPAHRAMIGHRLEAMAATNIVNPTRGHACYVATYQALGADKAGVNRAEFGKHRYILVLDEPHHLDDGGAWHEAVQHLVDRAALVCLMSGTWERGDGNPIGCVDYVPGPKGMELDFSETGHRAVIQYSLRDAWSEQAVTDLEVHYADCQARWKDNRGKEHTVKSLAKAKKKTAPALYTALHSEAALQLLEMGSASWQKTVIENSRAKLLVVAATIEQAKRYTAWFLERRLPVEIATSDDSDAAHAAIRKFKRVGPGALNVLITVAMAYEGLDVPSVTHLICLTHIRTRPWIEQVVHRATRVDYGAGPYHAQRAHIFAPDDVHFRACMDYLFTERSNYRATIDAPADEPKLPRMEGFGGGGTVGGVNPLDSSVTGVRTNALLENIRNGLMAEPSFNEIMETPAERMDRLRNDIQKICSGYEFKKNLPHGSVNKMVKKKFKVPRAEMTEDQLRKVLEHVERVYW